MWFNLYLHKTISPDLKNMSFPSTHFAEEKNEITRGCLNYGEAALANLINIYRGHLFKKFYRGFEVDILIWLPYDDEDNDLTLPFSFRFETGCSDPKATTIFNYIIKPYVLSVEFCHSRGKTSSSSHLENLPTYEFYNANFVARQFGLGQLSPRLFFSNTLNPREGISELMEALRIFQLGSELPSLHLAD